MLSEAHGGVLYVDEVNLLPAHLGDSLLDAASSGVNLVEREGFSASHAAEFVLLGSMNPEEGTLRPQLLDRFALAVDIVASLDPIERQIVVEQRIAFERDPIRFHSDWSQMEEQFRNQVVRARKLLADIECSKDILAQISAAVCEKGVRSLRADLAAVRASIAYAALAGDASVQPHHVAAILPLVLAHRAHDRGRSPAPRHQPQTQKASSDSPSQTPDEPLDSTNGLERIFAPREVETFAIRASFEDTVKRGISTSAQALQPGPVVSARRTETPVELDLRATLNHVVLETGSAQPRVSDLHERVRNPSSGTRYLFVIDSSGSHAAQERMRLVKGAASTLLTRSFKNGDEVAVIVFRSTSAQVVLEPTRVLHEAITAFEYLPTGGRTPLAHALDLTQSYLTRTTILILLTDGRANVSLGAGDPWHEALEIASRIRTPALVIDTESSNQRLGRPRELAEVLSAQYVCLDDLALNDSIDFVLQQLPFTNCPN
ncbi:magnesium chelatase subunit D [Granulicella arctica]|uniref:Magnesium chelatase subunit D n=1 Tax=Granulicella arctica TaxID=940613 RepID=A0A7Y9TGM1_9BACT|nr:magnesium chelatase subunit D [Granulicella arctica]